jgi:DNA repair photolyase
MSGCSNDCLYCYAKAQAIRFKRHTPASWATEKPLPLKKYGKRKGVVMFPTTHDITEKNLRWCIYAIGGLLNAGNKLLIVSKPKSDVIQSICNRYWTDQYKEQILFRFTIGSIHDHTLQTWEPNAPSFTERLYALMWCFKHGWQTSVSMEPMLDVGFDNRVRAVEMFAPYVTDAIWLGKMNQIWARLKMNHGKLPTMKLVAEALEHSYEKEPIMNLYEYLKDHPKVKWKDSIKKVVGIEEPEEVGLDI